ncbi:MAG: FecR family protein [Betaproteobacteria bacterium]
MIKTIIVVCFLSIGFFQVGYAASDSSARVDFLVGDVIARDSLGNERPLAKGAEVRQGDTIDTRTGRVQLRFTDGAYMSLQPGTLFRIDQYSFSGVADGSERGFFSLLKGGLRTISGLVGRTNKKNYQIKTTIATIGIRGTEYTVSYDGIARGAVGEGEIAVCNLGGCLYVASGQSYFVADAKTKPTLSTVRTSLAPPQPTEHNTDLVSGDRVTDVGVPSALTPRHSEGSGSLFGDQMPGGASNPANGGTAGSSPPGAGGTTPPPVAGQSVALALAHNTLPTSAGGMVAGHALELNFQTANVQGGLLEAFDDGSGITKRGTATVADGGNLGQIAWGRFVDGVLDGSGDHAGAVVASVNSIHYIVGKPTDTQQMPTYGTASYTAVGWTTPTTQTTTARLIAATLSANFSVGRVTTTVMVSGPGIGGVAMTASGNVTGSAFSGHGTAVGSACPTSCASEFAGFFAGPNAQYAGLAYGVDGTSFGNVRGTVAFRR